MAKNTKPKNKKLKLKTNKAALKRFKITATGKIMYWPAGRRHLQSAKNAKKRRQSRRWRVLASPSDRKKIHSILGSSHKLDNPQERPAQPTAPVQQPQKG